MPVIEINGKKVEAEAGSMIIEVADLCHVPIPRFCYHKKLSIAANCRMCLVEIEKAPKPMPACATPVTEGMKVWTHSPKALLAQKSVMEFLLINHPLDCPICDQGGECELQDLSMGYGADDSRFTEGKRVVKDKDIGPLIATNMTRCIHCTRCVRFGTEIAGIRELGATGRGECTEIGTFIEQSVVSEVSGNIIDLCPVGALTSKPFEYSARGWELKQTPSVAPHDNVGSHIFVQSRRDKVMRVVPKENELGNEIWISDRDRFSYEALHSADRLLHPKIKQEGEWLEVSRDEALVFATETLKTILKEQGPDKVGALISPNATLEECYLGQKLLRGLGSNHIDHRLRQQDFKGQELTPLFPGLGMAISELEQQSAILLLGSNIRKEQPILSLKLRKMVQAGGKIASINPVDFSFNFDIAHKSIVEKGELLLAIAGVAKAILEQLPKAEQNSAKSSVSGLDYLESIKSTAVDQQIAKVLMADGKKLILMGMLTLEHPQYSQIMALCQIISKWTQAKIGVLTEGANAAGAWIAGAVPHRLPGGQAVAKAGYNASEIWDHKLAAYLLLNLEPDLDCQEGLKALRALTNAQCVVAISAFESPALSSVADVLLPASAFSETPGTFVNVAGTWQSFKANVMPLAESRPAWKILRVLGNLLDLKDFDQNSSDEVLESLRAELSDTAGLTEWKTASLSKIAAHFGSHDIVRIAPVPLCAADPLVRRAPALQKTEDAGKEVLYLNESLAAQCHLKQGLALVHSTETTVILPYSIDNDLPNNTVLIAAALKGTIGLGKAYGVVKIGPVGEKEPKAKEKHK